MVPRPSFTTDAGRRTVMSLASTLDRRTSRVHQPLTLPLPLKILSVIIAFLSPRRPRRFDPPPTRPTLTTDIITVPRSLMELVRQRHLGPVRLRRLRQKLARHLHTILRQDALAITPPRPLPPPHSAFATVAATPAPRSPIRAGMTGSGPGRGAPPRAGTSSCTGPPTGWTRSRPGTGPGAVSRCETRRSRRSGGSSRPAARS